MKRLPISIGALVAFLAVFFSIRWLLPSWDTPFGIRPFLYAMVPVCMICHIAIPYLRKLSLMYQILIWAGIYLLLNFFFPFGDGFESAKWIIRNFLLEIFLVGLAFILARWLGNDLQDFVTVMDTIDLDSSKPFKSLKDAEELVQTEVYRSRRFSHTMNVVIVEPDIAEIRPMKQRITEEVDQAMASRFVAMELGRVLRKRLRRSDMMFEQRIRNRFIIVTPETRPDTVEFVMKRVNQAAEEIGIRVHCGSASFPNDAFTFDGLVKEAELNLRKALIYDKATNPEDGGKEEKKKMVV